MTKITGFLHLDNGKKYEFQAVEGEIELVNDELLEHEYNELFDELEKWLNLWLNLW